MPKEKITLGADGGVNTEFSGFADKTCFKHAAELAQQLAELGITTSVDDIKVTGGGCEVQAQQTEKRIETRG